MGKKIHTFQKRPKLSGNWAKGPMFFTKNSKNNIFMKEWPIFC